MPKVHFNIYLFLLDSIESPHGAQLDYYISGSFEQFDFINCKANLYLSRTMLPLSLRFLYKRTSDSSVNHWPLIYADHWPVRRGREP